MSKAFIKILGVLLLQSCMNFHIINRTKDDIFVKIEEQNPNPEKPVGSFLESRAKERSWSSSKIRQLRTTKTDSSTIYSFYVPVKSRLIVPKRHFFNWYVKDSSSNNTPVANSIKLAVRNQKMDTVTILVTQESKILLNSFKKNFNCYIPGSIIKSYRYPVN